MSSAIETTQSKLSPEVMAIIEALRESIAPQIPLSVDLWGSKEIGAFLKKKPAVASRYMALPSFPKPVSLPSAKGKSHPLYKATEVIKWAYSHQSN
jgi:hypothetical protein